MLVRKFNKSQTHINVIVITGCKFQNEFIFRMAGICVHECSWDPGESVKNMIFQFSYFIFDV